MPEQDPRTGLHAARRAQALGWGRSYISQLLTKQKALRLEQVLLILEMIGIELVEFFREPPQSPLRRRWTRGRPKGSRGSSRS